MNKCYSADKATDVWEVKQIKKSELLMEMGEWVQISLGKKIGKSSQK